MTNGILYIATARKYLEEAKLSASTAASYNHNLSVITSAELESEAKSRDLFDNVITIDSNRLYDDVRDKIHNICRTPYSKTIYIDCDTYILGDLSPIFDTLDRYDITAAHAPIRPLVTIDEIPDAFPELNTGVIGFQSSDAVIEFFENWKSAHAKQIEHKRRNETVNLRHVEKLENTGTFGELHGQPPFREALYKSDLRFFTLPREYNFRGSGWAYGKVKILHMGHRDKAEILKEMINKKMFGRTYVDETGDIYFDDGEEMSIQNSLLELMYSQEQVRYLIDRLGISKKIKMLYKKWILR